MIQRRMFRYAVSAVAAATLFTGCRGADAVHSESPSPASSRGAFLGPGCGLPAMDLANAGTSTREGHPVIAAVVGQPTTIRVTADPDRPSLDTTATVIVAAPGTSPGRGFTNPSQSVPGTPTLDDPSTWKASVKVVAQARESSQVVTFTPTAAGLYPVYVVEQATSTVAAPPLCGGIPDEGGYGRNVVGWVQVL